MIPEINDEKLKAMNFENSSDVLVIFSLWKVQVLFQIKLLMIENSAAKAFETPLSKEMFMMRFARSDLKIMAPTTLTTNPKLPTTPNFRNFWVKSSFHRSKKATLKISLAVEVSIFDSPAFLTLNSRGASVYFAPIFKVSKRSCSL